MRTTVIVLLIVLIAFVRGQNEDLAVGQASNVEDDCQCLPYYQCANNTIRTTAGRDMIQVRLNECSVSVDVCCNTTDTIPANQVTPPASPSDYVNTVCGLRNAQGVDFTLTGAKDGETNFGEFPWMVALFRREGSNLTYECGGSLIHPQVVLTAAHCVQPRNLVGLNVRAGEWDTQTDQEPLPHQDRPVTQVIVHEQFNSNTMFNDVALVVLQDPLTLDQHVNVVCLPAPGDNFDLSRCFSGGWGKDVFGQSGRFTAILKRLELPVVPRPICQNALRSARLGPYFQLDASFICAGGESSLDTCTGDGGGPLVCPLASDPDYYQQAGIVSWGLGCGERGVPGVYVNVAFFRDWIDQKMTSINYDTSSYSYSKFN